MFVSLLAVRGFSAVTVEVKASPTSFYLGESCQVQVVVSGAETDVAEPDVSALSQWADVRSLGQQNQSMSRIVNNNGRIQQSVTVIRIFTYELTPSRPGSFRTGPIRVKADGRDLERTGPAITVQGVDQQDTVLVSLRPSSTSVLVEEPFRLTLSVAIRALPAPYADVEPISPRQLPRISAEFLEIRPSDKDLKRPDINQILSGLTDRDGNKPAFQINNYQSRGIFGGGMSMFRDDDFFADPFQSRALRFRLPVKRITIQDKPYWEYTLELEYTPLKEQTCTFGPLSFKGPVITGADAQRRATLQNIYAVSPSVSVAVVPPPEEGCPDTFVGTVGKNIQASALLDTTVCKVGDPLQLTLEVKGQISLSNLRAPVLSLQTNLTQNFRIYEDSVKVDTLANGKRFQYRVRPMQAGTLEFPPVAISYYDTAKRAYETVWTEPIPIQAQATAQIVTDDTGEDSPRDQNATVREEGRTFRPSGITLSPDGVRTDSLFTRLVKPRLLWMLFFAGPAAAFLVWLLRPLGKGVAWLKGRLRSGGALSQALRSLRTAPDAAAVGHAVRTYLSKRFGVRGGSLTPDDAASVLLRGGIPQELADGCRRALAAVDEAMYRQQSGETATELRDTFAQLLPQIDAGLSSRRSPSPASARTFLSLLLALVCILPATGDTPAPQTEASMRDFLWEQATAQAVRAKTQEEFHQAANTYNRLVQDGVRNAPLFLNLGNTLLLAGDGANAAAAFARAERYAGASPETRLGLASASALVNGAGHGDLPWSRTAFFWHYELPCSARVVAALAGWCLLWLGITLRILLARVRERRRKQAEDGESKTGSDGEFFRSVADTCLVVGTLVAAVFAASVLMTAMHERHDDATWNARVFQTGTWEGGESK